MPVLGAGYCRCGAYQRSGDLSQTNAAGGLLTRVLVDHEVIAEKCSADGDECAAKRQALSMMVGRLALSLEAIKLRRACENIDLSQWGIDCQFFQKR